MTAGLLPHQRRTAQRSACKRDREATLATLYAAALVGGGAVISGGVQLTFAGEKVGLQEWARLVAWRGMIECAEIVR